MTFRDIIEFCTTEKREDINTLLSDHGADLTWDEIKNLRDESKNMLEEIDQMQAELPDGDRMHEAFDYYRDGVVYIQQSVSEVIKKKLEAEQTQAEKHLAVIHLHENGDDFYLTAELQNDFYSAASVYQNYMRQDIGSLTLDSLALNFTDYQCIDEVTHEILCDAMPNDNRITALIDFDFENNTLGVCESSDNAWRAYNLKDVSDAIQEAEHKIGMNLDERKNLFIEALQDKEILLEDEQEDNSPSMRM